MISANLNELELHTGTIDGDPAVEAHFAFPMFWATGNASTAVLCVELEPGKSGPRHIDMPEEILLVERGLVEIEVADERAEFGPGELVLVPAMVPHAFRNVGDDRARIVGFFSSNTVVAIADEIVHHRWARHRLAAARARKSALVRRSPRVAHSHREGLPGCFVIGGQGSASLDR